MIVVDASILTDVLLGRPSSLDALDASIGDQPQTSIHAPELIEPAVLQALRGLARGGKITALRAEQAVRDRAEMRLVLHGHAPLRPRVWDLRDQLSAYDATTSRSPRRSTRSAFSPPTAAWPSGRRRSSARSAWSSSIERTRYFAR